MLNKKITVHQFLLKLKRIKKRYVSLKRIKVSEGKKKEKNLSPNNFVTKSNEQDSSCIRTDWTGEGNPSLSQNEYRAGFAVRP